MVTHGHRLRTVESIMTMTSLAYGMCGSAKGIYLFQGTALFSHVKHASLLELEVPSGLCRRQAQQRRRVRAA